jgi:hypothetical protein
MQAGQPKMAVRQVPLAVAFLTSTSTECGATQGEEGTPAAQGKTHAFYRSTTSS